MMSEPTEDSDTVRVTDTPVSISKTVDKKPDGMVITYLLLSENDRQLVVRIRDVLPMARNVEEAGFHPEFEPESWDVRVDELIFEDVIPPGRGLDIVYGVVTSPEQDLQTFLTQPTIEFAQPLDSFEAEDSASSASGTMFRSSSSSSEGEDDSDDDSPDDRFFGEPTEATGQSIEQQDDAGPSPDEQSVENDSRSALEVGTGSSAFDGSNDDPDRTDMTERNTDESAPAADNSSPPDADQPDAINAAEEATATGEDTDDATSGRSSIPFGAGEEQVEPPGDGVFQPPEDAESGEERPLPREELEGNSGDTVDRSEPSTSETIAGPTWGGIVLDALLAELQETDPTDEDVEELVSHLGLAPARSKEVRLEKVESRVARTSAFADTFEDVVDEHGDLSTWMTDVAAQVADVDDRLETIEQEFDGIEAVDRELRAEMSEIENDLTDQIESVEGELGEQLSNVRDTVDSNREQVEERLDLFGEDLERIESELRSLESELDDRTTAIDCQLDGLDERLGSVQRSINDDIGALQDDVAELAEIRDVVADAFVEMVYNDSSTAHDCSTSEG